MVLVFALQIDNACEDDVIIVYCSEIPSHRLVGIYISLFNSFITVSGLPFGSLPL